jgi:hypothetical protein
MNTALAGLVMLVIGDSHMMGMMSPLHNELEDAGATVHTYAMCGATAGDYIYRSTVTSCGRGERHEHAAALIENQKAEPTYVLSELLDRYRPKTIVVELGDMMAGYGSPQIDRNWVIDQVHVLTGKIAASNIPCIWVGPPWGQDQPPYRKADARVREISQLLSTAVAPCRYIDSTTFSRPGEWPTRDGSHLQPDGYRKWATDITNAILRIKGQGS